MKATVAVLVSTIGLVLLADRVHEIGERIPFVLLAMWSGSAAIAALVFLEALRPGPAGVAPGSIICSSSWAYKMRRIGVSLLPLAFVPLLEIWHSGYDPALLLMNGVLVVSLCSVPFWWLLARSLIGAVVLSICSLSLLWHASAWGLFTRIVRTEAAKEVSSVDTSSTLHAFLAPEYRVLFYSLCGGALLLYCPLMLWLGYRQFLSCQSTQEVGAPNER